MVALLKHIQLQKNADGFILNINFILKFCDLNKRISQNFFLKRFLD